jgi:hypothetical protein
MGLGWKSKLSTLLVIGPSPFTLLSLIVCDFSAATALFSIQHGQTIANEFYSYMSRMAQQAG